MYAVLLMTFHRLHFISQKQNYVSMFFLVTINRYAEGFIFKNLVLECFGVVFAFSLTSLLVRR